MNIRVIRAHWGPELINQDNVAKGREHGIVSDPESQISTPVNFSDQEMMRTFWQRPKSGAGILSIASTQICRPSVPSVVRSHLGAKTPLSTPHSLAKAARRSNPI